MITLGLVAKNESKYLKEWVLYHKLIGVENFSIYLHNCTDNSVEIAKSLNIPFKEISTSKIDWSIKSEVCMDVIKNSITEFVFLLDIDEFIVLPNNENINDFLSLSQFDGFGGIALYQNIFGSNNHQKSPFGLVIENYMKRHPDNLHIPKNYPNFQQPFDLLKTIKTIIRKKYFRKELNNSHEYGVDAPVVDENGKMYNKYNFNRSTNKIRLNHYFTKSLEDWTFKTNRPRLSGCPKYPNEWFNYFSSFNYEDDLISAKYSSKIKELL